MNKIRKGDEVIVIAGKDKGRAVRFCVVSTTSVSWSKASIG
jgi:ribosomal protein L24